MKCLFKALLLCGALTVTLTTYAQKGHTSRLTVSTGLGILPTYHKTKISNGFMPINLNIGYDVSKSFKLSGMFGYSKSQAKPSFFTESFSTYVTNRTMVLGIRGELKKEFSNRVYGYGGSMLGLTIADVKEYISGTSTQFIRASDEPTPFNPKQKKAKFTYSAFMGAHVQLSKNLGAFGEVGYGISLATVGLSIRI